MRRAMREFGYSNARSIPRVGGGDGITTVVGFIECWSSYVVSHSDGGFLLRFELDAPLLCVGSLLCLPGSDAQPWTLATVRWIEDTEGTVMAGCEVLCSRPWKIQIATAMSSHRIQVSTACSPTFLDAANGL